MPMLELPTLEEVQTALDLASLPIYVKLLLSPRQSRGITQ